MFELVGIKNNVSQDEIGGDFNDHYSEVVVATFDKSEDAEKYIEASRLKKEIRRSFSYVKRFHRDSLLWDCEYAEVREHEEVCHNPIPTSIK